MDSNIPPFTKSNWTSLPSGSYKKVGLSTQSFYYKGHESFWVAKIGKFYETPIDYKLADPNRFIRKNQKINPDLPAYFIQSYEIKFQAPPTITEFPQKTVFIYQKLNRILARFIDNNEQLRTQHLQGNNETEKLLLTLINSPTPLTPYLKNKLLESLNLPPDFTIMPFLGKTEPQDAEIAAITQNIYKSTGNIIIDACIPGNFLKIEDKITCVDLDLAIERGSPISEEYLKNTKTQHLVQDFLDDCIAKKINPETARTTKALMYLEKCLKEHPINESYITTVLLEKYFILMQKNILLYPERIEALKFLIHNDPLHQERQSSITEDYLIELEKQLTLPNANSKDIMKHINRYFIKLQKTKWNHNSIFELFPEKYTSTGSLPKKMTDI